jgi:Protein of unknown function (DUF2782)
MKMKVIKVIATPVSMILGLIIFSFSAAQAGETDTNKKHVFSSGDVNPALIEDGLEPVINIQQFDNREVQEYSVNDRVYMVKITPTVGSPYYLVDPDGTGEMEYKRDTVGLNVNPPQWTLFRW